MIQIPLCVVATRPDTISIDDRVLRVVRAEGDPRLLYLNPA